MRLGILRIGAVGTAVCAVLALVVLAVRWIGYAVGGAATVCASERWMPWTSQYEATGSTPVTVGFGSVPLGLSCSSGGNVTYPDKPSASRLVVLAIVLLIISITLWMRPAPQHARVYRAGSIIAAVISGGALLGVALGTLLFLRNGWWEECGVPPVSVVGSGAIEAVRAVYTEYSVVPSGALCTFSSENGTADVFSDGFGTGSTFVITLAISIACATLAARSRSAVPHHRPL